MSGRGYARVCVRACMHDRRVRVCPGRGKGPKEVPSAVKSGRKRRRNRALRGLPRRGSFLAESFPRSRRFSERPRNRSPFRLHERLPGNDTVLYVVNSRALCRFSLIRYSEASKALPRRFNPFSLLSTYLIPRSSPLPFGGNFGPVSHPWKSL